MPYTIHSYQPTIRTNRPFVPTTNRPLVRYQPTSRTNPHQTVNMDRAAAAKSGKGKKAKGGGKTGAAGKGSKGKRGSSTLGGSSAGGGAASASGRKDKGSGSSVSISSSRPKKGGKKSIMTDVYQLARQLNVCWLYASTSRKQCILLEYVSPRTSVHTHLHITLLTGCNQISLIFNSVFVMSF